MTQATTVIKTTVILEFVTSPIIRCRANRDMPEYGILEGSIFYLAYSTSESATQGKNVYHILRWDYMRIEFTCPCKATVQCKHQKAANKDCAKKAAQKSPSLQGYKPASKAEKFAALVAKYDMRNQPVATVEPCTAIVEAEKVAANASNLFAEGHPFVGWKVSVTSHGSHGMPGHPIPALEAARGSLASSSRHMEMAPSGRMVPMR